MSEPAVSILMPLRNEAQHLPAALRSLQRQTLTDWELVIVDDGSDDNTPELLQTAARSDGRIRLLRTPPQGITAALAVGLAACRAPLVARMDGDDVCHPARLARQERFLATRPDIDLVACAVRHFPRPVIRGGMLAYEKWQNSLLTHEQLFRNRFVESPFAHPSVMFRREAVLAAGGYRDCPWAEDYDLWLRMLERGSRCARLPEVLFYWRDRPERLTRQAASCSPAAFRDCKLHYLRRGPLRQQSEVILWGAGQEGKVWRRALTASGIGVCGWIDIDPRKIGQTIHHAPVRHPEEVRPGAKPVLVTVGARGARRQIRAWAERHGWREERDYFCVT